MAAKMKLCRCLSKFISNFSVLWYLTALSQISYVHLATQPTTPSTNATTVSANTTTAAATTTVPPTTTTTTLPPTTTTIAPGEPRTVIGDTAIGQCLCDLTGNECDVNCCCDEDCTAADKEAFICDPTSVTIDNKLCYQEDVFLFSNSPETTRTENGLFCIYFDNYKERNYYLDPDFILNIPSFSDYVNKYGTPRLQGPVTIEEPVFDLNSFYRKGDTVYIVYPNEARGTFILPASSISNECIDQNSIGYLNEVNTECTRIIALDSNTCTSTAGLSAASYYQGFKVVKTSGLFGYVVNGTFIGVSTTTAVPPTTTTPAVPPTTTPATNTTNTSAPASNTTNNSTTVVATTSTTATTSSTTPVPTTTAAPTTVDPALIQTLYNNTYTLEIDATTLTHLCIQADGSLADCTFTSIPTPTFGNSMCSNVVQEVRYFVTTDGTNGIAQMQVQFVFRDIQAGNLPLLQRYSVSYNSLTDSNDTFARSGNPGYLIGKPLLYGTLNISTSADNVETKEIIVATEPSLGLTIVRASATGDCASTSSRIPVRFGEDMRSGCLIRLNLSSISDSTCQNFQKTIVETLEGPNVPSLNQDETAWVENNRYIGTFGNTERSKVGDWVKVISSDRPLPSGATATDQDTCSLRMGLHIQVLYANVGALANPQAKVIGVALLYDNEQDVKFRCEGSFCQPGIQSPTQAFEVSQTVSFVDVSEPATKFAGESPVFLPKIPNDFFYPFLYYTSGSPTINIVQQMVPVMFLALISLFINVKHMLS